VLRDADEDNFYIFKWKLVGGNICLSSGKLLHNTDFHPDRLIRTHFNLINNNNSLRLLKQVVIGCFAKAVPTSAGTGSRRTYF